MGSLFLTPPTPAWSQEPGARRWPVPQVCPVGRWWAPEMPHIITSKVLLEALPASLLWGIPSPLSIQQPRGHGKALRGEMG